MKYQVNFTYKTAKSNSDENRLTLKYIKNDTERKKNTAEYRFSCKIATITEHIDELFIIDYC